MTEKNRVDADASGCTCVSYSASLRQPDDALRDPDCPIHGAVERESMKWHARHGEWEGGRCCRRASDEVIEPLAAEVVHLRKVLLQVRMHSLLRIRQAAFAPKIGSRYTEAIRLQIAGECALLERYIDEQVAEHDR